MHINTYKPWPGPAVPTPSSTIDPKSSEVGATSPDIIEDSFNSDNVISASVFVRLVLLGSDVVSVVVEGDFFIFSFF